MASFCTRIYVKVTKKELMEQLCAMNVSDIGKGIYTAEEIFNASSKESCFDDTESSINENDLEVLVERVVKVIKGQGTILAETYGYNWDPYPQVCYYNGNEIISKLLDVDGGELYENINISNIAEWIQFVENADEYDE